MTYGVARAASSPELTKYRSPGKATKWRAAVFQPHTVYTARVNQVFATTDSVLEITYDTGSGTLANVLPDMTLLIGSSAGAHDIGICRLRDKDADTFFIGETSDIEWADNLYLTVVDDFGLWARHVLIDEGVSFMDGGVAYSDQHASPDPTPIMGSNRILELTGASVSTQFDGSSSYVVAGLSSISAYAWSCSTASSSSGTTTATPTFTFNTTGWHLVYLTATAANGKTYFGVRYVRVWNDADPLLAAEIGTPRQDVETGGWEFELTLYSDTTIDDIRDHALVILVNEDYFSSTQSNIGPVEGAENIEVEGWIAKESITWNPEQGAVHFTAYTAHYWLSQIPAFPDGVEFTSNTPTAWTEFQNLTVDKGLWHFLHWRTTATRVMDVFLTGDTKYTKEVSSLASNLWEQIREMAFLQIYARAGVNAWNQLIIQVHPQLTPEDERTWATVMSIQKRDWQGEIQFDRITKPECAVVALSGVAINSSGVGASYFSLSPGHAYPHYGTIDVQDKLLVASQSQANQLAGLYRGWRNNPYPEITLRLSANIRLIDCFPRSWCELTIDEADTPRGIAFSGHVIPTAVSIVTDPETGEVYREVSFEAETFQDLAVNGDIPGGRADPSTPPTPSFPPLPDFPIILPGTIEPSVNGPVAAVVHDDVAGMLVVENLDTTPVYSPINSGLPVGYKEAINWFHVFPSGALYVAFVPGSGDFSFLARAPSVGGTFSVLFDSTAPGDTDYLWGIGFNSLASEEIGFVKGASGANRFYVGSGTSYTAGLALNDGVIRRNAITFGLNAWLLTNFESYLKVSASGTSLITSGSPHIAPEHLRASSTGITYHPKNGTNDLIKGENNLGTSAIVSSGNSFGVEGGTGNDINKVTDCDPTGQYIMGRALAGGKGKSGDFGATWATLGSLPLGTYSFGYAGPGSSGPRFLAVGPVIRYTPDFGVTWVNKENSSLTALNPFPDVDLVQVLEY